LSHFFNSLKNWVFFTDTCLPDFVEKLILEDKAEDVINEFVNRKPLPIDIRNESSQSAIMLACIHNAPKTVEALLKTGKVDLTNTDRLEWTALHHAAYNNSIDCLQLLIQQNPTNAFLNCSTAKKQTPLHLVVENNSIASLEILLKTKETDVNYKDEDGNTPLYLAVKNRTSGNFKHELTL